jgi:hypothetical protein
MEVSALQDTGTELFLLSSPNQRKCHYTSFIFTGNCAYYLVVANLGKDMAVSKQTAHRVHMERFSLKKLNKVDCKSSIVLKSQISSQLWKT